MTHLTYRKITEDDFSYLEHLLTNPSLMLLGWGKTFSKEEIALWITKILTGYQQDGFSYFIVIHNNQPVGMAGLIKTTINQHDYVEIAYIIDEPFQGQGLATRIVNDLLTEAFSTYQLSEVIIQFAQSHHASQRIAEKNGAQPYFSYQRKQDVELVDYQVYIVKKEN